MHQYRFKMCNCRSVQAITPRKPATRFRYQGSRRKSRWEAHSPLGSQPLYFLFFFCHPVAVVASISLHKLRKRRVSKAEPFTKFNVNHCLIVGEHEAVQEEILKLKLDDVSCNEFPQCLDCAS